MRPSFTAIWRFACLLALLLTLLAACGQPVATPIVGAGNTATANPSPTTSPSPPVGATATTASPTASPTSRTGATPTTGQRTAGTVPGLATALTDVRIIRYQDNWSGLSPDAPLLKTYRLEGHEGRFEGTAQFSAARGANQRTATIAIAIPAPAARAFFQGLGGVVGQEGPYKPKIDHTDDYPSREIILETAQGPVRFYTQSQGNVPWGLDFAGRTYVINADSPSMALGQIASYLDDGTGQVLFDIARYAPFPGSRATPTPKPVAQLAVCAAGPATGTRPATPVAPSGSPVNFAAQYQLGPSYAMVITGAGVVPIPQGQRIVRDSTRLATFVAALDQPTPLVGKPNSAYQNLITLTFRQEGKVISLTYDAQFGIIWENTGKDAAYYLAPVRFVEELRGYLCSPLAQ